MGEIIPSGPIWHIEPPFANYPRARLERLVREGFEFIERRACEWRGVNPRDCGPAPAPVPLGDFQILMAADAYLRATSSATSD